MDLSLGPVLFDWKREELFSFYEEAANYPVSTIYIGEVVCPKKMGLTIKDLSELEQKLSAAGKKVYISSLALVADDMDRKRETDIMSLLSPIECNETSALYLGKGKELAAGPHINSYNFETVEFLKKAGVKRLIFPLELSMKSMKTIKKNCNIHVEAFAYGNMPLAFSWRCFTSRAFGRLKSTCIHDCRKFPEGMLIEDLNHKALFKLNGTQILSAKCLNLIREVDQLKDADINTLRISPQHKNTGEIVNIFNQRINGNISADNAMNMLVPLEKIGFCNGWHYDKAGIDFFNEAGANIEALPAAEQ